MIIFNVFLLLLLAGIVYIHWVQGLLSSVISMVCALVAACLAMGYYESVITGLLKGAAADMIHALTLPVMFGLFYIIPRVLIDMAVPGNVRVPHLVDKIGGGACGLVAGIMALGIVAITAQALPVGPAVIDYARYELMPPLDGVTANIPGKRQSDATSYDLVKDDDKLTPENQRGLWVPYDTLLTSFIAKQSEAGAMAGGNSFKAIHPDLVNEMFFQRLGPPLGSGRVNTTFARSSGKDVDITAPIRRLDTLRQADDMPPNMRGTHTIPGVPSKAEDPKTWLTPSPAQELIAIPLKINPDAADKADKDAGPLYRVSPGQIRLVAPAKSDEDTAKTYYPLGTLYRGNVLLRNHIDDIIYIDPSQQKEEDPPNLPYFVFLVDRADAIAVDADKNEKLKPGVFLEVKKLNYLDLSGKPITGPDKDRFPDGSGIRSSVPPQRPVPGGPPDQKGSDPVLRRADAINLVDPADPNADKAPKKLDLQ